MAFRKIRETVAAFRPKPAMTREERLAYGLARYEQDVRARTGPKPQPNMAVNIGVTIAVVTPVLFSLNMLLSRTLHVSTETTGVITGVLAFLVGTLHAQIIEAAQKAIPFYKLNPYFGTKLDETIAALRRTPPPEAPQRKDKPALARR